MNPYIEDLERVLESDPENVDILIELASLYGEEDEVRKAAELLEQAIAIDPENATAHYDLGVCYLKVVIDDVGISQIWEDQADEEEFFELATVAFQRALEIDPEFYEAHNNLGTIYALRGWNDQAKEHWEQSLELNPDQPDVREDLGGL